MLMITTMIMIMIMTVAAELVVKTLHQLVAQSCPHLPHVRSPDVYVVVKIRLDREAGTAVTEKYKNTTNPC